MTNDTPQTEHKKKRTVVTRDGNKVIVRDVANADIGSSILAYKLSVKGRKNTGGSPVRARLAGGYVEDPTWSLVKKEMGDDWISRAIPARSSYAKAFLECPRKFMLRYRYGVHPRGYFAVALETGTLFHEMMATLLLTRSNDASIDAASQITSVCRDALIKDANDMGLLPNGKPVEDILNDTERAFSMARLLFELSAPIFTSYLDREGWKPVLVERVLEATLLPFRVPVRCKPDAILTKDPDDLSSPHLILNWKTAADPSAVRALYPLDIQPKIEHVVWKAVYEKEVGHPLPACFYGHAIVQKCTLRFPSKRSPTWDDYLTNAKEWYDTQRLKDQNNPPFSMSILRLPEYPMTAELWCRLHELSTACSTPAGPIQFYRNSSACMGKYGNRLCPYYELCTSPFARWPDILRDRFVTNQHREDDEDQEGTAHD